MRLSKPDKPVFILETHAGAGFYDLHAGPAALNQSEEQEEPEYHQGIGALWQLPINQANQSVEAREQNLIFTAPHEIWPYLQVIRAANGFGPQHLIVEQNDPKKATQNNSSVLSPLSYPAEAYSLDTLRYYPGSPWIFRYFQQPSDRLIGLING